jgi:alkylhydroperoxidase/carboxymuconolactone decarboxylase family protein YurZ
MTSRASRWWSWLAVTAVLVPGILVSQVPAPPTGAYAATPYLGEVRDEVLYGDIWERPQLSKRDRSLITVAVNQALYRTDELRTHFGRALDNGMSQNELSELIAHVMFYSGFPTAVNASNVAAEVFESRGLPVSPPDATPRAIRDDVPPAYPRSFPATPYLRELLNSVLYGETWERADLSKRDRSLATVAVAQALYATDQLRAHMGRALDNGVTQEEIAEVITHVTFYAGFPTAVNASRVAEEVFRDRGLALGSGRYPATPYLAELLDGVLFGPEGAWERSPLTPRERSLVTMAVTQALYETDQLRAHINRALDNGVTPMEISELLSHVTFYAGFPTGVNGSRVAAEVFESRGLPVPPEP